MIELRQLLYALAAADQRSFARAANRFHMKQSTLSRKVTRLEDQLGFRLFDRSTSGAQPTADARAFLDDARALVEQAARLEVRARALRHAGRPRLALGYSGALFSGRMGAILYAFLCECPDVRFDAVERAPEPLLEALASRQVDAVIVPAGCGAASLASMRLWQEPLRACFGSGHRLAAMPDIGWHDLEREHLVLPAGGDGPVLLELVRKCLAGDDNRGLISIQDASIETICQLIAWNEGVCVQRASAFATDMPGLCLRTIGAGGSEAKLSYVLHWHRDNDNSVLRCFRRVAHGMRSDVTV